MTKQKKNLFAAFKSSSKEDWTQKAGAPEQYTWQIDENIALDLYHDRRDIADQQNLDFFKNRLLCKKNTGEPRSWENIQKINVKSTSSANQLALEALHNGADGIVFDLTDTKGISFDALLQNIRVDYCIVSFIEGTYDDLTAYCNFLSTKNIDPLAVNGIFSTSENSRAGAGHLHLLKKTINYPQLKVFALVSTATGITDEIADLLLQTVSILDPLIKECDFRQIASKVAATVRLSPHFFEEIAKVRALRILFFQLFHAYGYGEFKPEDLHIHCVSTPWNDENYQPNANMLKATTAAMAAIIGGCDSLLIEPEDYDNPLMVRMARNVSTILKEESYLNKTADPAAGAYSIAVLTDKLAEKAWKKFQEKVKYQNEL